MPNPTNTEIELVREIAGLRSLIETSRLVARLSQEQWTRMQELFPRWNAVRTSSTRIRRGGVELRDSEEKMAVRAEARLRLGLPETMPLEDTIGVTTSTDVTPTRIRW